ncbi:MAG: DUF2516 family protein [Nocardioidaceae bacterium]|nr:DUF2516 family protein [Nocardioidaceae bacterium]
MQTAVDAYLVFSLERWVSIVLWYLLFAVKVFALGDAVVRSGESYVAAEKQTKVIWLLILAVALTVHVLDNSPIGLLNLVGTVAAFVYLADVRPILRSMHRR